MVASDLLRPAGKFCIEYLAGIGHWYQKWEEKLREIDIKDIVVSRILHTECIVLVIMITVIHDLTPPRVSNFKPDEWSFRTVDHCQDLTVLLHWQKIIQLYVKSFAKMKLNSELWK